MVNRSATITCNDAGYWICLVATSRGKIGGGGFEPDGAASDAIAKLQNAAIGDHEVDQHFASIMNCLSDLEKK